MACKEYLERLTCIPMCMERFNQQVYAVSGTKTMRSFGGNKQQAKSLFLHLNKQTNKCKPRIGAKMQARLSYMREKKKPRLHENIVGKSESNMWMHLGNAFSFLVQLSREREKRKKESFMICNREVKGYCAKSYNTLNAREESNFWATLWSISTVYAQRSASHHIASLCWEDYFSV